MGEEESGRISIYLEIHTFIFRGISGNLERSHSGKTKQICSSEVFVLENSLRNSWIQLLST